MLRTVAKVIVQDAFISGAYWTMFCLAEAYFAEYAWWQSLFMLLLWATLFLLLFFSNAELFKWVKDDGNWSILTGTVTLLVMLPLIIICAKTPCPF